MSRTARDFRPVVDGLEARLTLSATAAEVPDTIAVLEQFTRHYPSRVGNPKYDPAFDLNHNGIIGQGDGKILLHRLPPVGAPRPLNVQATLAIADQARGQTPQISGGATHKRFPTVVVHTTPGALIFTGTGTIDVRLHGGAYVADQNGNARMTVEMKDGANQFDILAIDSRGHQRLRAFPILWLGFAAYQDAHPRNT